MILREHIHQAIGENFMLTESKMRELRGINESGEHKGNINYS